MEYIINYCNSHKTQDLIGILVFISFSLMGILFKNISSQKKQTDKILQETLSTLSSSIDSQTDAIKSILDKHEVKLAVHENRLDNHDIEFKDIKNRK